MGTEPLGSESAYQLGAGDRISIRVFNQDDLSGEYSLDEKGRFSMPLIGAVRAEGLTPAQLENILVSKLRPDYLVNPRVTSRRSPSPAASVTAPSRISCS
jgi:polysaccharide export outer membrane protein